MQAKRHKAFVIYASFSQKKNKFDEFETKKFDDLVENFQEYLRVKSKQVKIEKDLDNARNKSVNFKWLNNALNEYEHLTKITGDYKKKGGVWKWILFGGGLLSVLIGAILSLVDKNFIFCAVPGFVALLICGVLIYLDDRANRVNFSVQKDMVELKRLKEEFSERIEQKLSSKTSIKTAINEEAKYFHLIDAYESDLTVVNAKLENLFMTPLKKGRLLLLKRAKV